MSRLVYSGFNQFPYGQAPLQYVQQPVQPVVVQQPEEVAPQSVGPVQTQVQQQAPQLGESRFEYIPRERVWVEYEPRTITEQVPKEVKLTDHYAVEHITEYHPQVFHDTYVDYHPQQRLESRTEFQQVVRRVPHPPVSSEITETLLAPVPGPQQLIQSQSQIVETGKVQETEGLKTIAPQVLAPQVAPYVGSRVVPAPQLYGSRVVAPQVAAPQYIQPSIYGGYGQVPYGGYGVAPFVQSSRVVLQ